MMLGVWCFVALLSDTTPEWLLAGLLRLLHSLGVSVALGNAIDGSWDAFSVGVFRAMLNVMQRLCRPYELLAGLLKPSEWM